MHYCLHLFTKEMPTEEEIEKILEPYEEYNAQNDSPIVWDWYQIGGRYREQLETKSGSFVDMTKIARLKDLSDLGCYAFIDMNGKPLARDVWDGDNFIKIEDFDEQYQKALEESKDGYLTVIDIHE